MNWIDTTHSKTQKWQISILIRHLGLKCKLRYGACMLKTKTNFFSLISVKVDRPKLGTCAHFVSFCNFYLVTNFKTFLIFCEKGILGENFWLAFIMYIFFEYLIWLKALTLLAILVFLRKCRLRFMHIYSLRFSIKQIYLLLNTETWHFVLKDLY